MLRYRYWKQFLLYVIWKKRWFNKHLFEIRVLRSDTWRIYLLQKGSKKIQVLCSHHAGTEWVTRKKFDGGNKYTEMKTIDFISVIGALKKRPTATASLMVFEIQENWREDHNCDDSIQKTALKPRSVLNISSFKTTSNLIWLTKKVKTTNVFNWGSSSFWKVHWVTEKLVGR